MESPKAFCKWCGAGRGARQAGRGQRKAGVERVCALTSAWKPPLAPERPSLGEDTHFPGIYARAQACPTFVFAKSANSVPHLAVLGEMLCKCMLGWLPEEKRQ